MAFSFSEEELRDRLLLFKECDTKEDLQNYVYYFLDLELPGTHVDPESNSSPLDMVWDVYDFLIHGGSEDISRMLFYSCRFGGKSLCEAVIEVMLLLHFRGDITHLAALKRQSKDVQKYIKKFFKQPALRGFVDGDNKEETQVTFYIDRNGGPNLTKREWDSLTAAEQANYVFVSNSTEVVVATVEACNGKHGILCLDEIDVMRDPEAYSEAKNIPTPCHRANGELAMPLAILTSTRKYAFGMVQTEINEADKTGLVVRHWNILDVTKACPASRHRPDLPKVTVYRSEELLSAITPENWKALPDKEKEKYVKDEAYHGCMHNCKMFSACKGHLASKQTSTSKFLKPIPYVQNQFRNNSLDKALTQLLCRKPSSEGQVYPKLDKAKHVLSPSQAYEKISGEKCPVSAMTKADFLKWVKDKGEWYGGMDFGSSHCWAYVHGVSINNSLYVTHAIAAPELDASEQVEHLEPFREYSPTIYPDQEDPQMIKAFKKAGFMMMKWKKGPGSVASGISVMKMKMAPTFGKDPELFFVRDLGQDPQIDLLFQHLQEHNWKIDAAGRPTNAVSDVNKDLPDALRYLVMNKFAPNGEIVVTADEKVVAPVLHNTNGQASYDPQNWMAQKISELTGVPIPLREPGEPLKRPAMTVEPISGDAVFSYYGNQNKAKKKEEGRTGTERGIVWDFE
jgi:hypothetical protein